MSLFESSNKFSPKTEQRATSQSGFAFELVWITTRRDFCVSSNWYSRELELCLNNSAPEYMLVCSRPLLVVLKKKDHMNHSNRSIEIRFMIYKWKMNNIFWVIAMIECAYWAQKKQQQQQQTHLKDRINWRLRLCALCSVSYEINWEKLFNHSLWNKTSTTEIQSTFIEAPTDKKKTHTFII